LNQTSLIAVTAQQSTNHANSPANLKLPVVSSSITRWGFDPVSWATTQAAINGEQTHFREFSDQLNLVFAYWVFWLQYPASFKLLFQKYVLLFPFFEGLTIRIQTPQKRC
jgi:hypothetical protein